MFQFPSLASGTYVFSDGSRGFAAGGCPIRKSPGQSLLGGSPELIAACHVLHRLLTPGHPPCALIRLITTQRMKKIRTHSQDRLSKNRGRAISRDPIKKPSEKRQTLWFLLPLLPLVEVNGIEPMTSWLQTRRSPN
jgi:hypothetical protein